MLKTGQDCWEIVRKPINASLGFYIYSNYNFFFYTNHREQTVLLNRERVNKGTKRMNSLSLPPLVISFILRDTYWENCCLQILRNTEALYSYLGLSAFGKNFFVCIKFVYHTFRENIIQSFVSIRFSQHDRTVTLIPSIQRALALPSLSHTVLF